ncbi:hypothetical protein [Candidatus Nanohalovita haloferacivicina]|uniref:hypothetical protein n=1 Tax=Candidatus Nanohalovita haloferacivicina TaxID=2978046 RepID=UPI00325FA92D|nr:hypothetical protein HBNXNv_0358 [Candidatus Nanohalobia archaeon BNXNv]
MYQLKRNINSSVKETVKSEDRDKAQASFFLFKDQVESLDNFEEELSRSEVMRELLDGNIDVEELESPESKGERRET